MIPLKLLVAVSSGDLDHKPEFSTVSEYFEDLTGV